MLGIDSFLSKRSFRRVLHANPVSRKIVAYQLHSYPAAMAKVRDLANLKHVFVKAAARVTNREENGHPHA